jgi:hypothetical protein
MRGGIFAGRSARIAVAGLGVAAVLFALPAFAGASFPGKPGKIAIVRGNGIYTLDPDGSNLTPVASGRDVAWSPDGKRLAFVRSEPSLTGLYISNADGTESSRIVTGGANQPAFRTAWRVRSGRLLQSELVFSG